MPARTRPFEEFLLSSMISASVRRTPCQGNAKRFPGGRRGCRTDQAGLPKCQESQPAMEGPEPASGPVACRRCPRGASCSSCHSRHQSDMSDAGWVVIEPTLPSRMEAGQGRPAEHCHLAAGRKPDRLLRSSTFSRSRPSRLSAISADQREAVHRSLPCSILVHVRTGPRRRLTHAWLGSP
jgi:hypothetical protein